MGGCASKPAIGAVHNEPAKQPALPRQYQTADVSATSVALALTLLAELRASTAQPSLPVEPHAKRLNSGHRGLSRKFLAAIRELYGGLGALDLSDASRTALAQVLF